MKEFSKKYSENCAYDVNFFFSKKSAKLNIADISLKQTFLLSFPDSKIFQVPGRKFLSWFL